MDNKQWGLKLKADYKKKTGDRRNIRLPEPNEIVFGGEDGLVTITMEEKAVVGNLQTDAAAFRIRPLSINGLTVATRLCLLPWGLTGQYWQARVGLPTSCNRPRDRKAPIPCESPSQLVIMPIN